MSDIKADFDPGFSPFVMQFDVNFEAISNEIAKQTNLNQKKFKFRLLEPMLVKLFRNNTAFYLGCLLWATFLKFYFKSNPQKIIDNPFLGKEIKEDDYLNEVRFLLSSFDKFDRDCKYFLNKPSSLEKKYVEIVENYLEFLQLNKNFTQVSTTDLIELPELASKFNDKSQIEFMSVYKSIKDAIKNKNIEGLLELY